MLSKAKHPEIGKGQPLVDLKSGFFASAQNDVYKYLGLISYFYQYASLAQKYD
jgi:hypothetical protein